MPRAHPALLRWVRATRWRQTSQAEAASAEQQLLASISCRMEVKDVVVGPTKDHYVHTLTGGPEGAPPVVFMPGYAAGIGFFYRNFEGLTQHMRLHTVDWLGTGLSGRPAFEAKSRQEAEDFFTESLNAWRKQTGLTKFVLVGHSLGGYLAAQYALKHPEQVEHLVLVCPAGVPLMPEDARTSRNVPGRTLRNNIIKFAMWTWERGLTPGTVIRGLGPWGPGLVNKYVSNRFQHHESPEEAALFGKYMYSILADKGSGEYALRHLLAPGAWAHAPLAESLKELKVPVSFIYGESDWMKPQHGLDLVASLALMRAPKVASDLTVQIIPNSGHFTFLDEAAAFNKALLLALKSYLPKAADVTAATSFEVPKASSASFSAPKAKSVPGVI